jgi:hypothetical protein
MVLNAVKAGCGQNCGQNHFMFIAAPLGDIEKQTGGR